MIKILNDIPSVANHFLYEMRHKDIQKDRAKFRNNLKRLGMVMAYEISKTLAYQSSSVTSSLGATEIALIKESPLIIAVLRAAIPFMDGFAEVFHDADIGFVGAWRKEGEGNLTVNLDYKASPSLKGRTVIIVDPMLATGQSIVKTINDLSLNGSAEHLHIATAVSAPEGIDYVSRSIKQPFTIWTGALDEKLNEDAYIVPGLGDAGDLSFGPKL